MDISSLAKAYPCDTEKLSEVCAQVMVNMG